MSDEMTLEGVDFEFVPRRDLRNYPKLIASRCRRCKGAIRVVGTVLTCETCGWVVDDSKWAAQAKTP